MIRQLNHFLSKNSRSSLIRRGRQQRASTTLVVDHAFESWPMGDSYLGIYDHYMLTVFFIVMYLLCIGAQELTTEKTLVIAEANVCRVEEIIFQSVIYLWHALRNQGAFPLELAMPPSICENPSLPGAISRTSASLSHSFSLWSIHTDTPASTHTLSCTHPHTPTRTRSVSSQTFGRKMNSFERHFFKASA